MTAWRRDRTHRSGPDRSARGRSPAVFAPESMAKRVGFQILLVKLRLPFAQSSLIGTAAPGLAPRVTVKRAASAPYRSIHSSGSTTLPADFDIFLPWASRTRPVIATVRN